MLAIPATTTQDSYVAATSFPGLDGGGTPFVQGFLFVANNSATISISKGKSTGQRGWTPDFSVAPTMVPLVADRSQSNPDFIYGVRVKSLIAGSQAVFFGALFQQGEIAFIPSAQFAGTVSSSGGFTASSGMITGQVSSAGAIVAGTGFTVVKGAAGLYTINFNTAFATIPHVSVRPIDGNPRFEALQVGGTGASVQIILWNAASTLTDMPFTFSATAIT